MAEAVLAVPHVAGLHGGRFGEVATYLPGRRVVGIRLHPAGPGPAPSVEVHVVARYPATVTDVDVAVRAAVRAALNAPAAITVRIEDVVADRLTTGGPFAERPVIDLVPPRPAARTTTEPETSS